MHISSYPRVAVGPPSHIRPNPSRLSLSSPICLAPSQCQLPVPSSHLFVPVPIAPDLVLVLLHHARLLITTRRLFLYTSITWPGPMLLTVNRSGPVIHDRRHRYAIRPSINHPISTAYDSPFLILFSNGGLQPLILLTVVGSSP